LIDHRFPVEEAVQAYNLLTNPEVKPPPLGILLTYPQPAASEQKQQNRLVLHAESDIINAGIGLSVIGTGNFLSGTLLPILRNHRSISLKGVVSHSGLSAKTTALQGNFRYCSTDVRDLFQDPKTQAIVIATRHDSHADLLCQALQAGKHVFLEKPLATNREELAACIRAVQAHPKPHVLVGFNRRFAPFSVQLKKQLDRIRNAQPLTIHYRVLAGAIAEDSWIHQFGGRVVGEVCHFVDWCQYITQEQPVRVTAQASGSGKNQDLTIQLMFSNGSIATIHYLMRIDSATASACGKERIELSTVGLIAEIDDFATLKIAQGGRASIQRPGKPDKGHAGEIAAFIQALHSGHPAIPFESIALTTETTFAILDALQQQAPVAISLNAYAEQGD
jgi:polar amino acid transport system substrate-binding protein